MRSYRTMQACFGAWRAWAEDSEECGLLGWRHKVAREHSEQRLWRAAGVAFEGWRSEALGALVVVEEKIAAFASRSSRREAAARSLRMHMRAWRKAHAVIKYDNWEPVGSSGVKAAGRNRMEAPTNECAGPVAVDQNKFAALSSTESDDEVDESDTGMNASIAGSDAE